jgi:hypothetical protein
MNRLFTVGIVIVVVLLTLVASVVISGWHSYNSFWRSENHIEAYNADMKNVHGSILNNIKTQGLTAEKYFEMVIKGIEAAMTGRYGTGGSKSAMQWIQENNPTIDSAVILKLQSVVEASYNKFEAVQRSKIDAVRIYKDKTRSFPGSFWAWLFTFPKRSWSELEKLVVSEETEGVFQKGKMGPINPFKQ